MRSICRPRLAFLAIALAPLAIGCVTADDTQGDDTGGKGDSWNSSSPERLADIPFYFSIPKPAVTVPLDRAAYPYPTLWNKSVEGDAVGLRIIAVKQSVGVAAHQTARREMAAKLAAAGVLKDGDIVLTFRPELA